MKYYFNTTLDTDFDTAIERVTEALRAIGFGIQTEIDVTSTFKKKLDVEFRKYRILGACNPHYAYKALSAEDKIGTMLPCNVIVQEVGEGKVEIAAVNPIASMQAIENESLGAIAQEVTGKLQGMIESL